MSYLKSTNSPFLMYLVIAVAILLTSAVLPSPALADEYDDYGRDITNSLINGDAAAFTKAIDKEAVLNSVFKGMTSDEKTLSELRRGLSMGLDQIGDVMVQSLASARIKYLRSRFNDNRHTALVRIDFGEKGINYLDFVLNKDQDGNIKVTDWYDYSKGQHYTESVSQAIGLMLPGETTLIERLLGTSGLKKKEVDQFIKLGRLMREQKFVEWLKLYDKLPKKLKESRVLLLTRILVTVAAGDDDTYRTALKDLHTKFGDDPTLSLILIDHYFFEEDYETAQSALDRLSEHVGGDASIDALKANIYLTSGDYKNAMKYSKKAIEAEAEYEDAYWTLFNASILAKAYDTSTAMLDKLDTLFGYKMYTEDIEDIEDYKDFVESEAYKKWKKKQSAGE